MNSVSVRSIGFWSARIFTPVLDFAKLSADYVQVLTRQVVPLWLKSGRDNRCGGYFDYLSATGEAIDGDKFVTTQAQQTWAFAWLYNHFDAQAAYLQHARHGGLFLSQFAHDSSLHCYAQLDRRGRPVAPATDILPACSIVMAYAELYRATNDDEWGMLAKQTFGVLLEQHAAVRDEQTRLLGGFRTLRHLNHSVALLKAALAMRPLFDEERAREILDTAQQDIFEFIDRRTDTLREFILPEGAFLNTPEGRRQHAGLTFRTISALLDVSADNESTLTSRAMNRKLASQVTAWGLRLCDLAWDETAGGLVQYVDQKGQPFIYPDWQQRWAWVQVEALSALGKAYYQTHQSGCLTWFRRIHDYLFQHFPDPQQPGWFPVLDQTNQPLISAKAIPAADSFIWMQALAETAQTLTKCGKLSIRGQRVG